MILRCRNQFYMEMIRSLYSHKILLTILLIPFTCIVSNIDVIMMIIRLGKDSTSTYSAVSYFNYTTTDGWFLNVIFVLAMLPAGLSYYYDRKERFGLYNIIRSSVLSYSWTIFISIIIITWITVFLGLILLACILCAFFPICSNYDMIWAPYNVLASGNIPFIFFIVKSSITASLCCVFVAGAAVISTFLLDRFVIMISPFILYYVTERVTLRMNTVISIRSYVQASLDFGSVPLSFIGTHTIMLIVIAIIGNLFVPLVERNVRNGIN